MSRLTSPHQSLCSWSDAARSFEDALEGALRAASNDLIQYHLNQERQKQKDREIPLFQSITDDRAILYNAPRLPALRPSNAKTRAVEALRQEQADKYVPQLVHADLDEGEGRILQADSVQDVEGLKFGLHVYLTACEILQTGGEFEEKEKNLEEMVGKMELLLKEVERVEIEIRKRTEKRSAMERLAELKL